MKKNKEEIFEIIWGTVWTVTSITFIVLKLFNVIAWSWWWVLSPIWGLIALPFILLVGAAILIGAYYIYGVMKIYWKHWRVKK